MTRKVQVENLLWQVETLRKEFANDPEAAWEAGMLAQTIARVQMAWETYYGGHLVPRQMVETEGATV